MNTKLFLYLQGSLILLAGIMLVFLQNQQLVGFGVIFIAIGINILLFKPVMKNEITE